jgi:hypothetical protein
MPTQRIFWKGKTFNQVVAGIKMNQRTVSGTHNFFAPMPIKHYRKEIASQDLSSLKSRRNLSVDAFFYQPGGTITVANDNTTVVATDNAGGVGCNVLDIHLTMNSSDRPCLGGTYKTSLLDPAKNARARVRSAGMIRKKFVSGTNNDTYYTDTTQYLKSRSRTFDQNQFHHIQYGDASVIPGTNQSMKNIYSSGTVSHCQQYYISTTSGNNVFTYQWWYNTTTQPTYFTVTVPDGYYEIGSLNNAIFNILISNGHYIVETATSNKVMPFKFVFDNLSNRIQLQILAIGQTNFPSARYSPGSASWTIPTYAVVPVVNIPATFSATIGFDVAKYPLEELSGYQNNVLQGTGVSSPSGNTYVNSTILSYQGTSAPGVSTRYVPVYYKPSNSKFGVQGSVDAGERIARLKFDTITKAGASYSAPFGRQTANALAYGTPGPGYTIKDKIGYPIPKVPIVTKQGVYLTCPDYSTRGG